MPILGPGSATFTICDLQPLVLRKVENRTNDTDAANEWIAEAIIEITTDQQLRNDLIELEVLGPTFNLTVGVQEYPDANFINSQDANLASLDIFEWIDFPNNQIRVKLLPTHYQEADKFMVVNSLPVKWYRFGGMIGVYPVPDKTYQVQSRYLKKHPIDWNNLCSTVILLSDNWREIIILAAAQKGFLELEEYEKASAIGTLLRGDPKDPTRPGMLYGRKLHREREAWRTEQALRPMVRSYTHWPRG